MAIIIMMNALTRLAASSMWPCMTQTVTCVWSRGCGQPGEVCSGAHGKQWAPTRWYTVGFRASVTLLLYTSACSSSANVFETFDGSLCSLCTTIQWGICSVWLVVFILCTVYRYLLFFWALLLVWWNCFGLGRRCWMRLLEVRCYWKDYRSSRI